MLTNKDYCDYETCVALKELGFPQDYIFARYAKVDKLVDCTYHKKRDLIIFEDRFAFTLESESIVAPLLYEAQKWLREEKFLLIVVDRLLNGEYVFSIVDILNYSEEKNGTANSYEEALSEGIKEAVKTLKDERVN